MVTIYQETIQVARINNFKFLILTSTSLILMIFIGPENHQFTTSSSIGLARVLFGRGLNVGCHGWWITLARSIPRKFPFSSQTKYSPPLKTFVSVVNPYLQNFFRWIRKATFHRFCRFVVESESVESAEIFTSWRFFVFLY